MTKLLTGFCLLLLALAFGTPAKADTMGTLSLPDCGGGKAGCPAAYYQFDITSTSATLKITITGTPTSKNDLIGSVDLGFASSGSITGLGLTAAPSSLGYWTDTTGSLNSSGNGCGINSGAFVCATALPLNPLPISQNGVYTWTWTFNSIDLSGGAVHVGVQYGPNSLNNPWNGLQVSQNVSPVPEPASMLLLGSGLLTLAGFARRRAKKV